MGRYRVAALILAVAAFGMAGLGPPEWFEGVLPLQAVRTGLFWAGVACFLAAAWGRGGT